MKRNDEPDDMLPEYDFRGGVRGKYAERFTRGSNVVVLDPDVAEVFTSSADVNAALRALAGIIRQAGTKAS
jgi:Trm5-related predicted tRNA methylase